MIDQMATYQAKLVGPGAPNIGGSPTPVNLNLGAAALLFVPGWTFLGGTYDAVFVQPAGNNHVGLPVNANFYGFHNSYIVPGELSWKLGDSGFYVKAGLGIGVPDGTITGANGLGNIGSPWWTFVPQVTFSYLKDGWNLTAAILYETNTKNTYTGYRSGDVLDVELIATKRFGNWTVGPVGYYVGQIGNDTSSAFYNFTTNLNRYNTWAVGGLVGYDFGRAALNVWAVDELSAKPWGSTPAIGPDRAITTQGWKLFASLSYRLWAPDAPAEPKRPPFLK
jgi:hypothetical protein